MPARLAALRRLLPLLVAAGGLGVGLALSQGLADYAVFLAISVVVSAIAILGLDKRSRVHRGRATGFSTSSRDAPCSRP